MRVKPDLMMCREDGLRLPADMFSEALDGGYDLLFVEEDGRTTGVPDWLRCAAESCGVLWKKVMRRNPATDDWEDENDG